MPGFSEGSSQELGGKLLCLFTNICTLCFPFWVAVAVNDKDNAVEVRET